MLGSGPGRLLRIDPETAAVTELLELPFGWPVTAGAFAYWEGSFYFYVTPLPLTNALVTTVWRYRSAVGELEDLGALDRFVSAAGVSRCTPL